MSDLALDIPTSFFAPTPASVEAQLERAPASGWEPQKAQIWYDSIIDWMFANPGGSLKECAASLGRSPVTIGLITRSDLFKARYAQRRAAFNTELDHRLVGKLASVAEKGLDFMLEVMEKKRDQIPLPLLNEITKGAMDRLGYGAQKNPSLSVQINNTQQSTSEVVSADSLAKARENMRLLEGMKVVSSVKRSDDPLGGSEEGEL